MLPLEASLPPATDLARSIYRLLSKQEACDAESCSLLAPGRQPLTYARLQTQVVETARALNRHGIAPGDRVALVLKNGPEMAACFLAVSSVAACAPLNPAYRVAEFEFYFSDLLPRALVVEHGVDSPAREVARLRGVPVIELLPHDHEPAGMFSLVFTALGSPEPSAETPMPVFAEGDAVALVLHTSGTTSRPKMVPLTHANLCHSAWNIKSTLGLGAGDRCLNVMPLFHIHGLVGALLSSLAAGGSIVCSPGFVAPKFFGWLADHQATWYTAVPTMHQAIAAQAARNPLIVRRSPLRFARSSSSALSPRLMAQLEHLLGVPVVESYGMTEAAHQMASNALPPGRRKPGSVGPAAGPELAVVDEGGNELDSETEGDVVVRGPNVMHGYLSTLAPGDEAFVAGWFRTGDRGWLDADGYLFLTGRTKEIINRGGEKISPREIDDVLMEHPAVAAALAFSYPDARLGEDVGAAVVLREGASATETDLREFASLSLIDFKVPRRIVFVDELPKGPTGKPQRIGLAAALGVTDSAPVERAAPFGAPRTPEERLLCDLWSQALGRGQVGIHDHFFELGGDSILAGQIVSRVQETMDVDLSLIAFFEDPTVAGVASRLGGLVRRDGPSRALPFAPRSSTDEAPLSFAQLRIWFSSELDPHAASNVTMAIRLDGALDRQALNACVSQMCSRHDILRTTFPLVDGRPVQKVESPGEPGLKVFDLGRLPVDDRDPEMWRIMERESSAPFDLVRGPLLRASLIGVSAERHVLQIAAHHIIADAWSRRILLREIVALYRNAISGAPDALPPLAHQYADFATWQVGSFTPGSMDADISFWRKELAKAPTSLQMHEGIRSDPGAAGTVAHESAVLSGEQAESLRAFSRGQDVSLFMTMAAGFLVVLHWLTGEEDIVLGVPTSGRNRPELEPLVGCFVNTLLLRTDLSGNPAFDALLARVRGAALGAYEHQDLPFEKLVEALPPQRTAERFPLFNVMLNFVEQPYDEADAAGLRFVPLDVPERMPNVDVMLYVKPQGDALNVRLQYRRDVLSPDRARRAVGHLQRLLEQIAKTPRVSIRELAPPHHVETTVQAPPEPSTEARGPALEAGERERICVEWNNTSRPYPPRAVHELFEAQAAQRPDAVALVGGERLVTYGELNRRGNRLAERLRAQGVGRDVPVGVYMERSPEMIVGWLGILKAGGAYVPLAPADPPARLRFLVADTGIGVVLTPRRVSAAPVDGVDVVQVDLLTDPEGDAPAQDAAGGSAPDDLAYVMYTSGSTGRPKGVEITHRGIVRLLFGVDYAAFDAGQVWLQLAPPGFDLSTLEVWGALLHGARCVLFPGRVPTAVQLGDVIRRHGVNALWLTAALFNMVIDEAPDALAPVRQLLAGGEALSVAHVRRALAALPATRLVNGYGPTESTTFACCYEIPRQLPAALPSIPIGRPIGNTRVYVLDELLEPVPIGVSGELYIGGDGLARGYRNRPGLTGERFVGVPAVGEARLYRTGDRARFLPDGNLEFLGRFDQQVKIRGFRIELEEIQFVLESHPSVQSAAVAVAPDEALRDQRIVAYVVVGAGKAPSRDDLRAFLALHLPEPMIPSWFEYLHTMPLTPNGKLDRQALPAPDFTARHAGRAFVAPRTDLEITLAAIFAEVLNARPIGVEDNFFDLGGHSLLITRVLARVNRKFDRQVPLRQFYDAPTVAALAAVLDQNLSGASVIPRRRSVEPVRLSFAQERLWFWDRLTPGSALYNVPLRVELDGPLNRDALQRALDAIVARHESLRTSIRDLDGTPVQVVSAPVGLPVTTIDLTEKNGADREEALATILEHEATRPYDLSKDLMIRATLVQIGASRHTLLVALHHIATDAWSLDNLFRELGGLYGAYAAGRDSGLPELPIQYSDYAEWQRRWVTGELLEKQLTYWKSRLEGQQTLQLPADRPRPAARSDRGASEPVVLGGTGSEAVRRLSATEGLVSVLLSAFAVLLQRYSQQDDISIGVPVANRTHVETEALIGFFVNTAVVRVDLAGALTFRDVLRMVKAALLGAQEHQDVPFEQVVEALRPERSLSYTPLFQVMFAPHDGVQRRFEMGGVDARVSSVETGTAKFDLTLELADEEGSIGGTIEYSTDRYEAETIRRMATHYGLLLHALVANPDRPVSDISLVAGEERRRICEAWNDTRRPYPQRRVHELFEAQAARRPDAVAVIDGERQVSYGDLNRRANRLARRLRAAGVGRDVPVGVYMERSPEMIVGWLGILKAGGAYVPLSPTDPPARLALLVADTGIDVVVTSPWLAGTVPGAPATAVVVDVAPDPGDDTPLDDPPGATNLEDLAYVMYTSGSTGRPKGVEITHRGIVRLLFGTSYATFDEEQVWLQLAPPGFDASTLEVWGALLHGARSVVFPDRIPAASQLSAVILRHGVTALWLTSSLFNAVVDEAPEALLPIRQLLIGGEALSVPHVRKALATLPAARLVNGYGPTESTTFACCYQISQALPADIGSIPIGRPIGNTRVYVLDALGEPVPIGIPGELYIGGDGLARGYRHRPELTAERFVAAPRVGETRLYRTGDRARYLPEGHLEFLGRFDHQVKIRGFRIETIEIEAALSQHPAVESCVVAVHGEGHARRLAAYVVVRDGGALSKSQLRAFARATLPEPMIPAGFVFLDRFPLAPNGKVDREAFPPPDWSGSDEYMEPRDPLERELVTIWEEVLGVHPIGIRDNFFDRGGHSLAAMRLFARIEKTLRAMRRSSPAFMSDASRGQLLPALVFRAPTIERLAEVLRQEDGTATPPSIVPIQPHGSRAPFFWIHGDRSNAFLAEFLGPDQPLYGVEHQSQDGQPAAYTEVETIAEYYLQQIRRVRTWGPYLVGGYSFGGTVAFEVARRLSNDGHSVPLLVMLDAPFPGSPRSRKASEDHAPQRSRAPDPGEILSVREAATFARALGTGLRKRFNRLLCSFCVAAGLKLPASVRSFYLLEVYRRALRGYAPQPFAGRAVYFKSIGGPIDDRDRWRALVTGGLEVSGVPGNHMDALQRQHAALWATRLSTCISDAQSPRRG